MDERLTYTVEEAARLLGIGRGTAYEAARRGELPVVRLGYRLLVPRARLEQMLTATGTDSPQTNGPAVTGPQRKGVSPTNGHSTPRAGLLHGR